MNKNKKEEIHGDEKIYSEFCDLFNRGQSKKEKDSAKAPVDEGPVVTPKNPESQEWHAREDVLEEREHFHDQ